MRKSLDCSKVHGFPSPWTLLKILGVQKVIQESVSQVSGLFKGACISKSVDSFGDSWGPESCSGFSFASVWIVHKCMTKHAMIPVGFDLVNYLVIVWKLLELNVAYRKYYMGFVWVITGVLRLITHFAADALYQVKAWSAK